MRHGAAFRPGRSDSLGQRVLRTCRSCGRSGRLVAQGDSRRDRLLQRPVHHGRTDGHHHTARDRQRDPEDRPARGPSSFGLRSSARSWCGGPTLRIPSPPRSSGKLSFPRGRGRNDFGGSLSRQEVDRRQSKVLPVDLGRERSAARRTGKGPGVHLRLAVMTHPEQVRNRGRAAGETPELPCGGPA